MATGIRVAFTGHRPDKLGGYDGSPLQDRIGIVLKSLLAPLQPDVVISGMALGVDTISRNTKTCLPKPPKSCIVQNPDTRNGKCTTATSGWSTTAQF